jgi:hypothetical protein
MKIVFLSLIILLLIILCINLENYTIIENFNLTSPPPKISVSEMCSNPQNISTDRCNDNDISRLLDNANTKLDNLRIFKDTLFSPIASNVQNKINTNNLSNDTSKDYPDSQFTLKKNHQNDLLSNLKKQVNEIASDNIFYTLKENKDYKSVKSQANFQDLNIIPLSNNKYMISLNGKCLESNSLNKSTVRKCDQQNPNQHFSIDTIMNTDIYQRNLGFMSGNTNFDNIKYPFHIIKSDSGNCISTKNKTLSVGPCVNDISQRWEASTSSIICKK